MLYLTIDEIKNSFPGAIIESGAIIEKGNSGLVLIGSYKYSAGCYFDSNKNVIINNL